MGSSKKQTIGYKYFMGQHMAMCYGPVDALIEIRGGDRTAWTGSVTTSSAIAINARNLWGGDEKEGGIEGTLDVMMGEATQAANGYLTAQQGALQPAYRGILSTVFRQGLVGSMTPYLKPWAYRVRRIKKGWLNDAAWYPTKAELDLGNGLMAMNPAHIVYECLTNPEWGMGYPAGALDDAVFRAAADVFHAEGMGLCMKWNRSEKIREFIQVVLDHAGAACGQDRRTGLFVLRAIRDTYDPATLLRFTPDNCTLEGFDRAALSETINEISITFVDASLGTDSTITVQQLANIQAQGGVVSQSRSYPGLPTAALAHRIAMRDLRAASTLLARVKLRTNRVAYNLLAGDVVVLDWPKLGILGMPVRIGAIDDGQPENGEVRIEAVEDVFGLPLTSYAQQQPIGWVPPDTSPQATPAARALEVSFRDLSRILPPTELAALPATTGFVASVAARPNGVALNYKLHTRVSPAAYALSGEGDWTPTATLAAAVAITSTTATLALAGSKDLSQVRVGAAALLGDEIVRVDGIDTATGVVTLGRGSVDTVPRAWPIGTRFWAYEDLFGSDPEDYADGEIVDAKIQTVAGGGVLDIAVAPVVSVTLDQRQARPYPPGDVKLNGSRFPVDVQGGVAVTWAHRDRLLQADQLVDQLAASVGPEAGTTYTVRVVRPDLTVARTVTGVSGTTWTYTESDALTDAQLQDFALELYSVRAALDSWQRHAITVERHGLGFRLGEELGGI